MGLSINVDVGGDGGAFVFVKMDCKQHPVLSLRRHRPEHAFRQRRERIHPPAVCVRAFAHGQEQLVLSLPGECTHTNGGARAQQNPQPNRDAAVNQPRRGARAVPNVRLAQHDIHRRT